MIKIAIILGVIYLVKTLYVSILRKKRNALDLTLLSNRIKCNDINNTINILNGYLWSSAKKK